MKRINVIGTTGSGKSTFAKALAEKLGYPCFHLDQLFWKPNWVETGDEELFSKVEAVTSGDCWVLDGNYNRTNDIKWRHADTVIWLDYSFPRTFFQLLRRTLGRVFTRREIWPRTGNRESFKRSFMSRDSIFLWFFRCYKKNKVRYSEFQKLPEYRHIRFVRLCRPKDARAFIESARNGNEPQVTEKEYR